MKEHDIVIVGAGPAGLTCGMYCARADLDAVIVEKLAPGGQIAVTELVENYPGFDEGIMGADLASKMEAQARRFGLPFASGDALKVTIDGDYKILETDSETYKCKVLVVASGTHHRKIGIPGEDEMFGRGVSNCATCDGPLYRGKIVTVVGGGDSAVQESLFLAKFASTVKVIHRRDELRAIKILADKAMATENIEFVWNSLVTKIIGDDGVDGINIVNKLSNEESVIDCDGFFIFIGMIPNTDFLKGVCKTDEIGFVHTNQSCETDVKGIYTIGDARVKNMRQVATAVGDGASAAHDLEKYID
jgi:thioredoxin reductase (NADPH)